MNRSKAAAVVGEMLVKQHPKGVDIASRLSHGTGGGKTMIEEGKSNISLTFSVENTTPTTQAFVLGDLNGYYGGTLLKEKLGASLTIADGLQILPLAGDGEHFDAKLLDSDKDIDAVMAYVAENPTRVIKMNLQSHKIDGTADTSNFASGIKSFFLPPLQDRKVTHLDFNRFNKAENFSSQFLNIDFREMKFPMILGKLNKQVLTINSGTRLAITLTLGAQISDEQELYRIVNEYDSHVHPYTDKANCGR